MRANATITLSFICIIVFALQVWYLTAYHIDLVESYALYPPAVKEQPYRIITAMFLHAGIEHIAQNLLALLIFGTVLESIVGTRRFLLVYFLAGIAGNIAGIIAYPNAYSLGASGAIMGVVGCLVVLRPFMLVWFGGPIPLILLVAFWVVMDVAGIFNPYSEIGNAAHLAGLFVGIMFGKIWKDRFDKKKLARKQARSELSISEEEFREWEDEWMRLFKS